MKVLFADTMLEGHHEEYLNALIECADEAVIVLPEGLELTENCKLYICKEIIQKGSLLTYWKWFRFIRNIARKECVDIIHLPTGDFLLKVFGVFLRMLGVKNVIITFHHYRASPLRNFSRSRIFKRCCFGVVHTDEILSSIQAEGITNCVKIDYPQFMKEPLLSQSECRNYFGIHNDNVPVMAAIGGTRYDKGLDILIEALRQVKEEQKFHLLIAGVEDFFLRNYIEEKIASYRDRVSLYLQYLTDDEFMYSVKAADFIVVPYREQFDGASGPLVAGVSLGKTIIGSKHGSLGEIIKQHHLGYTFKSEDAEDLAKVINKALSSRFLIDEEYEKYKEALNSEIFKDNYKKLYKEILKKNEY